MLTIETLSYVLPATGERSTLIDSDIVFHESGFPYIPARRIKGLFRESLIEVLEMHGNEDYSTVQRLFGNEGNTYENAGCLSFDNAWLENWNAILTEINNSPIAEFKEQIKEYYTSEISQTTINDNGIAKDGSLRNYRVLNPNHKFYCAISSSVKLVENDVKLLGQAALNLRYMGTRRNRGFGKISVRLDESKIAYPTTKVSKQENSSPIELSRLEVELTSKQPLILSALGGDQNTVSTSPFISGSAFRGALANAYMQSKGITSNDVDKDALFHELFLSGNIQFPFLHFEETVPLPYHIHKVKDKEEMLVVFEKEDADDRTTKPLRTWGILGQSHINEKRPKVSSSFHTRRQDRKAGRSTEDEGAIFYYDALAEQQTFKGTITGNADSLKKLMNQFGKDFPIRIGKSKSAQYGQASIFLKEVKEAAYHTDDRQAKYYMHILSPLIILDDFGQALPSLEGLKKYIPQTCIPTGNIAASFCEVESYNSIWGAKTDKVQAFKEGSVIEITLSEKTDLPDYLGEMNSLGYGRVQYLNTADGLPQNQDRREDNHDDNKGNLADCTFVDKQLKAIQKFIAGNLKKTQLKTYAIQLAHEKLKKGLNNHQLGRMVALLDDNASKDRLSEVINAVKRWTDTAKKSNTASADENQNNDSKKQPKPIYKALERAGLESLLKESTIKLKFGERQEDISFTETIHYITFWKTFFLTLRKLNKKA
jgi:CRISPR-associated protein Csx10